MSRGLDFERMGISWQARRVEGMALPSVLCLELHSNFKRIGIRELTRRDADSVHARLMDLRQHMRK